MIPRKTLMISLGFYLYVICLLVINSRFIQYEALRFVNYFTIGMFFVYSYVVYRELRKSFKYIDSDK